MFPAFVAELPVLLGPDKHSRSNSPQTTAIFEAFAATYQKFAAA
jgi:hypothetical protein